MGNDWKDDAIEFARILSGINWRSADKDNMEFAATITYVQMDAIREILQRYNLAR